MSAMYIFVAFLTLLICRIYSLDICRYPFEGILYAEQYTDSNLVRFSKTERNEWRNLTNLANSYGLRKKGIFCSLQTHSGWIAYPEANYFTDSFGSNEVTLLIGEGCVETENIESLQPLLPLGRHSPPTLIVFKHPNFIGFADALDLKSIELGESELPSEIGSLILYGSKSWTLRALDGSGRSVCVFAGQHLVHGKGHFFCPLLNLEKEANLSGRLRIQRGCFSDAGESEKVELTRCYGEGDHIIWTERATPSCKEELSLSESEAIDELAFIQYIWRRRMQFKISSDRILHKRKKLSQGVQNYLDIFELAVDFAVSFCEEMNEEFWLTLKEVVVLQVSTFSLEIQRDFALESEAFQEVVELLQICGATGNSSASNGSVADVVNPSSFVPTDEKSFSEPGDESSSEMNSIGKTQQEQLKSVAYHCESNTKECDISWDKAISLEESQQNPNSSFVSVLIEKLINSISFKCSQNYEKENEVRNLLRSTIVSPVSKQFKYLPAHRLAFNGLGITKELMKLNKCTCKD